MRDHTRVGDSGRREADNGDLPVWARLLLKIVFQYGLPSVAAGYLIYVLATSVVSGITVMNQLMVDHIHENRFYLKQMCIVMSKQAGEPVERCSPDLGPQR